MSTTKNCPKVQKKKTLPPEPVPVPAKVPCPRDQQAYALHLEKHSQRWIAAKLKCTQPTVLRGIRRMEKWLAKTLPEDRGEYTATEKLRLAMAKHERLMEAVIKMSLREFRRSRKTIPMKKQITTTETKNEQGEKVKVRVEEWNKPQIGRKGFLDATARASHEITVLAAGWLGPGNGSMSMAEVMDPEERDRWDRIVTTQKAQIAKLEERAQELESPPSSPVSGVATGSESRAERPASPVSEVAEKKPALNQKEVQQVVVTSRKPRACADSQNRFDPKTQTCKTCIREQPRSGSCAFPNAQSLPPKTEASGHESEIAPMAPAVKQTSPDSQVASPIRSVLSGNQPDTPPPVSQSLNQVNQVGVPALADLPDPTKPPEGGTPTLPEESRQPPRALTLSDPEAALRQLQIRRLNVGF